MKEEMVEVGGLVIDKQRGGRFKIQVDKTEHIVRDKSQAECVETGFAF